MLFTTLVNLGLVGRLVGKPSNVPPILMMVSKILETKNHQTSNFIEKLMRCSIYFTTVAKIRRKLPIST